MSRVIQDSDDELDDDLDVGTHHPEKQDATPQHSTSDTSSTEALRRQIEAAHRAHLQSQFPVNDGHAPVVIDGTHQIRKMPAGFDSSGTSSEHFALKGAAATYGDEPKGSFINSPLGQQENQNYLRQDLQPTATTNGTDWVLDGTMREAYAQHNPNAMFPEPSSTVPNATLTQQRVLEGVLAPALLGSDIDAGRAPFQPDASIPWSEYLKSPTNTGERPKSSAQETRVSQIASAATSESHLHKHSAASQSQRSRQGSLMLVGSPPAHDTRSNSIDAQDITMFTEDKDESLDNPTPAVDSLPQEELPSLHCQSRKKRPSPALTLDDDLADLGLPKEQYKPRPSRSRSLKVGTQESIDYSIRPEKATKASRQRRSTTTTGSLAKPLSTPERIRQICDMGFTPSTSERALERNNGDVTQSVDWLVTNRVADDELVCHNPQMAKPAGYQETADTGTRRQRIAPQTSHLGAEQISVTDTVAKPAAVDRNAASTEPATIAPIVAVRSPTKVQVVIPTKLPKQSLVTPTTMETSGRKAKRRKTTLDPPEPTTTPSAANEAKVEKKRGRGRPKKAIEAPVSTDFVQYDEDEQVRGHPLLPADNDARPITAQSQGPEHETNATVISKTTPEPPVFPNRPEVEPITPERVKKPAVREQASNNKGKVSYRVGLSKRAKIAPLLRVMKK
ncbi:hypothetical protein EKO04_006162 [Ascochyta lentis]|uniref:UBA domain-containing protein n=1 Tax=Ascochyta lentis TaxID=205686 RepID=A0A8H7J3E9_9PLEO|nr:hypothetical protein EKO04_006162 [Ascochyta lentis]